MRIILSFIFLTLLSISSWANPAIFEHAGFSINILDGEPSAAGGQPLIMMLPAINGFSANVNVQIQPYPGTLLEYKKLSDAQFIQLGFKTITSKIESNVLSFEYSGVMGGQNLHFYSKAIQRGNLFYLVTATDLDINWSLNSKTLKKVVDSFILNKI